MYWGVCIETSSDLIGHVRGVIGVRCARADLSGVGGASRSEQVAGCRASTLPPSYFIHLRLRVVD